MLARTHGQPGADLVTPRYPKRMVGKVLADEALGLLEQLCGPPGNVVQRVFRLFKQRRAPQFRELAVGCAVGRQIGVAIRQLQQPGASHRGAELPLEVRLLAALPVGSQQNFAGLFRQTKMGRRQTP